MVVKCYKGCNVERLTDKFVFEFIQEDWRNIVVLLILIGTNDVKSLEVNTFEIKYRNLLSVIRARLGNVQLVLLGIPPRPRDHNVRGEKAKQFNKVILRITQDLSVGHFPLYKPMCYKGAPKCEYFVDKLHLSRLGVAVLVKVVKQFRHKIL